MVHKTETDAWPDDSELGELIVYTEEMRHAWAIAARLARRIKQERSEHNMALIDVRHEEAEKWGHLAGDKPATWTDQLASLEGTIVSQRAELARLNESRNFEAESERLLRDGLGTALSLLEAASPMGLGEALAAMHETLDEHTQRKGPRKDQERP